MATAKRKRDKQPTCPFNFGLTHDKISVCLPFIFIPFQAWSWSRSFRWSEFLA